MKNKMIGFFLMICSGFVFAQASVFKWVDQKGIVHYGDRPSQENNTRQEWVINKASLGAGDSVRLNTNDAVKAETASDSKQKDKESKEKLANDAAKQKDCDRAKAAIQTLQAGGRISFVNENGVKEFLSEIQVTQRLEETKKIAEEVCKK